MGEIIIFGCLQNGSLIFSHTILNGLPYPPIDFHEQANHIRGPNFTVSQRPSKMKNVLEQELWTNRNQEFRRRNDMKQRRP
jgi:hypothetical protein